MPPTFDLGNIAATACVLIAMGIAGQTFVLSWTGMALLVAFSILYFFGAGALYVPIALAVYPAYTNPASAAHLALTKTHHDQESSHSRRRTATDSGWPCHRRNPTARRALLLFRGRKFLNPGSHVEKVRTRSVPTAKT